MNGPLPAIEFLTRIRIRRGTASLDDVTASLVWFPAVGLLIGLVLFALDRLAMRALPQQSVDVLLVVALALTTGALHLDGLADAADGVFGGQTPEHRLAIMRDPQRGSFAIVAVVSVLALKWAGFSALPSDVRVEAIMLAPCLARCAMIACIAAYPYAREQGMGTGMRGPARTALIPAAAYSLVVSVVLLGWGGLVALAVVGGCALAVGWYATRSLGGVTGDIYGASVEIAEAGTLLFLAAMANRNWIEAWLLS